MHQKISYIAILLASFAGLMGEAQSADDPAVSARVRVYQAADITLYPGEFCYGSDSPAAIHSSTGIFSIFSLNKRVGMPETDDIPGSYQEYVIPAGIAMSVMLTWEGERNGVKASCGPIGSTFYPQAGNDYDVALAASGNCFVQIRQLHETSPGIATAIVAPSGFSYACVKH